MKFYIGARMADGPRLRIVRERLFKLGHEVISSWLDEIGRPEHMDHEIFSVKLGMKDLTEIRAADVFVIDTLSPLAEGGGGGREFEYGFAFGQWHHKECWLVGDKNHAFHFLADRQFFAWDDILYYLGELPTGEVPA